MPSTSANICHGVVPFLAGQAKKPVEPRPENRNTPSVLAVPGVKAKPVVVPLFSSGWPSA